jgi:indolepyruvate ferredoxin oxidoreductase alpha subunit
MLGNEAIARGAIEGGVEAVFAYPGTPSSEVVEELASHAKEVGYYTEWSINEKVAIDSALGSAIVGSRTLCAMKNAGLNVAMDTYMTMGYGGVRGGLIIVVADDPGAFYSSNEQDTRFAARYANILCLEPSSSQEAKDMAKQAFEYSERSELPVHLRTCTRISHSSGDVVLGEIPPRRGFRAFDKHWKLPYRWNVYGPPSAVDKHRWLLDRQPLLEEMSENSPFNELTIKDSKVGFAASGIAYSYLMDALVHLGKEDDYSILKLGIPTPMPEIKVLSLMESCEKVFVLEEGDSLVEPQLTDLAHRERINVNIFGKQGKEPLLEKWGELGMDRVFRSVSKFLNVSTQAYDQSFLEKINKISVNVSPRSSTLCVGCPHLGSYWALKKAFYKAGGKVWILNGDIGCYEQGGYGVFASEVKPSFAENSMRYKITVPYEMLDTNYVMGGGIGLAQGQFHAGYKDGKIVAIAGDSTFYHACLPALANAVYNKANILFIILDNSITAMTGHQPSPTSGYDAVGDIACIFSIEDLCKALGVKNLDIVDPWDLKESEKVLEESMKKDELSVVIMRRQCTLMRDKAMVKKKDPFKKVEINFENCNGCKICIGLGCPAVGFNSDLNKATIDLNLCTGCGMCNQTCPFDAIKFTGE